MAAFLHRIWQFDRQQSLRTSRSLHQLKDRKRRTLLSVAISSPHCPHRPHRPRRPLRPHRRLFNVGTPRQCHPQPPLGEALGIAEQAQVNLIVLWVVSGDLKKRTLAATYTLTISISGSNR
jgi:hypothetical protein